MFNLSLKSLARVSRNLATLLSSGVAAPKAFEMAGRKAADPRVRRTFDEIAGLLRGGDTVTDALEEVGVLPELYVDMVQAGEESGNLAEVLRELADHYDRTVQLQRDFRSQITMPVVQAVAAVFVIAGLIFVLGLIGTSMGGGGRDSIPQFDPTGLDLRGGQGAVLWLAFCFGSAAAAYGVYRFGVRNAVAARSLHRSLLRLPVLGDCMQKFALARFSWAYHLTQNAGLPIEASLRRSTRATGNGAFAAAAEPMIEDVYAGDPLSEAIDKTGLFPEDYVELVHVGETTGTVPETLERVGPQLESDARRSLRAMTTAAGWLVWAAVATLIIFFIIRFAMWYVSLIGAFMP